MGHEVDSVGQEVLDAVTSLDCTCSDMQYLQSQAKLILHRHCHCRIKVLDLSRMRGVMREEGGGGGEGRKVEVVVEEEEEEKEGGGRGEEGRTIYYQLGDDYST